MKTNKDIINERYKGLVKNWGESAQLLSFNNVLELMNLAQLEMLPPKDVCTNCGNNLCDEEMDEGECFNCGTKCNE